MSNKTIRMIISISLNALVIALGVFIVFKVGTSAYNFGNAIFNEQSVDTADNARTVEVTIKNNMSTDDVAELLYDKGLVENKMVTYFQITFSDYKDNFIAGNYELTTSMKPSEMFEKMTTSEADTSE